MNNKLAEEVRDQLLAVVGNERLVENTGTPEDVAYNQAIQDCMFAIRNVPLYASPVVIENDLTDEQIAQCFHIEYERLAPAYGYATREETRKDWSQLPANNKELMIAVCSNIRAALQSKQTLTHPAVHLADSLDPTDQCKSVPAVAEVVNNQVDADGWPINASVKTIGDFDLEHLPHGMKLYASSFPAAHLTDADIISRCEAAGIRWSPPEEHHPEVGAFPAYFHMSTIEQVRALLSCTPPATACNSAKPYAPAACPVTGRKFWGNIEHPELGYIATYGGPFDTYTIPTPDEDGEFRCERFDQDRGHWIEGGEPTGLWIANEQPADDNQSTTSPTLEARTDVPTANRPNEKEAVFAALESAYQAANNVLPFHNNGLPRNVEVVRNDILNALNKLCNAAKISSVAPPQSAPSPEAINAKRWEALISSPYLRLLGSAGFGLHDNQPDESGYRHFGLEAWSICGYAPEKVKAPTDYARDILVKYADQIIANAASQIVPIKDKP